ncbi:embryonic protein DC-8-like [Abrus precatorius]|uniref:Embryonic protein DC-8-like n=1 Tax=Abrus precatorius TaxID=3816 RepID=A0A8B8LA53_ABRPR|nr:embryonic protein DC-8-like [Abrus precatorius]
MASRQQFKEDRAEAAAKLAAKDIGDINRANEREEGYTLHSDAHFKQARAEAAAKLAAKDLEDVNRARESAMQEQREDEQQKPSVIGSMFRAAKEAVVGKPQEGAEVRDRSVENPPGVYDSTWEKTKETKDAAKQKAEEYADYASQKAKETKDKTMDKAGEYKDYAADKAKEAKDATVQKAGEYKDYTAEKAKEGKDNAVGKLGELKDSAADAAKKAMGLFTGRKEEAMEKTKEKVSGTEEVRDYGGGRGRDKMVIEVEESRPGAMADTLKVAEQVMSDVGRFDDEGVVHVERRREKM